MPKVLAEVKVEHIINFGYTCELSNSKHGNLRTKTQLFLSCKQTVTSTCRKDTLGIAFSKHILSCAIVWLAMCHIEATDFLEFKTSIH